MTFTAAQFTRTVTVLTGALHRGRQLDGAEWLFMLGETDVQVWVPRVGYLVLQLVDADGRTRCTATVCPGIFRAYEVIAGNRHVITETRGAEAAVSAALDHVTAAARAAAQHDHDPCAV